MLLSTTCNIDPKTVAVNRKDNFPDFTGLVREKPLMKYAYNKKLNLDYY